MRVLYALQKFVVCVMLLCSVCGAYAIEQISEENYSTYGFTAEEFTTYEGYYVITNEADLFAFADLVNGGNNAINAVITADIELTQNWTPIAFVWRPFFYAFGAEQKRIISC